MATPVVTIQKNGQLLKSLTLDSGEAVLGRGEGCVIRLDDRAVSRQHAVIKAGPTGLSIEKKSHLAPLLVNGTECDTALLKEGDEVLIGPYLLKIVMPVDAPKSKQESRSQTPDRTALVASGTSPQLGTAALNPSKDFFASADSSPSQSDFSLDSGEGSAGSDASGLDGADQLESQSSEKPLSLELDSEAPAKSDRGLERSEELSSIIEEDARTRLLPQGTVVKLKLKFSPGAANIEMREFDQDEISIGRGKGCDVVLNDKKASRKHLIIRRQGVGVETNFVIRDLESANGIYVNNARVTEHVLSGDDLVRVGDTEFVVQAVLPNYEKLAENFLKVDNNLPIHEQSQIVQGMARIGEAPSPLDGAGAGGLIVSGGAPAGALAGVGSAVNDSFSKVVGIGALSGGQPGKMSLLDRYKALPPKSRVIWLAFISMSIYTVFTEFIDAPSQPVKKQAQSADQSDAKKKQVPGAPKEGSLPTFEQLDLDKQKFVDSQYNLALEYYRNRDFDRSLYEVRKIFQYVTDYRDARDLERYSVEAKQRLQAQEEERRRKEIEQANKARVAKLMVEVEGHMARKEFVSARELFAEIVALQPDNSQVPIWRKEIEAYEESLERERQLKKFEAEQQERARQMIASGNQAIKERRWAKAISAFSLVFELELKNQKLVSQAQNGIKRAKSGVVSAREPLLAEARRLEQESNYAEAFRQYSKASKVDPSNSEARKGMDRMREYLRDRSKQLYTEGVLAESYSDFELAKSRFEQLLSVAPPDDPYYERARRKLSRYSSKEVLPSE